MNRPASRPPGRPRSETARRAVLGATLELAAERGPRGLSMEAIAKRAGVSKDTLYRWWNSKIEVVLEALADRGYQTIPVPDTGSLRSDLRLFLRATVTSADSTTVALLRAIAADAALDADIAQLISERFIATRRAALAQLLNHAVARGEITPAYAATAVDLIYGSLWYRLIFAVGPLNQRWAEDIATALAPPTT